MDRTYLAVFAQSPEDIVELLGAMKAANITDLDQMELPAQRLIPPERAEKWAAARVEDQLVRFWVTQMDRYSDWTIDAIVETLESLGLLSHNRAILWGNQMRGCPLVAGVVEDPARKWCAYCGDLVLPTGPGAMDWLEPEPEPPEWTEPLVMPEPEPMPEPEYIPPEPEPMPDAVGLHEPYSLHGAFRRRKPGHD